MNAGQKVRSIIEKTAAYTGRILNLLLFSAIATTAVALMIQKSAYWKSILLLSAAAILLIGIAWDRHRETVMQNRKKEQVKKQILHEKLLMTTDAHIENVLQEQHIIFIRSKDPEEGEILSAISKGPAVLICLKKDPSTVEYIHRYSPSTVFIDAQELVAKLRLKCSEEEVETRIVQLQRRQRKTMRNMLRLPFLKNRYFVLGMLLLVLSFVTGHKIYYRLLSAICLFFSIICGASDVQNTRNIFGFFLDNMDR